jgi:hypothetical protein
MKKVRKAQFNASFLRLEQAKNCKRKLTMNDAFKSQVTFSMMHIIIKNRWLGDSKLNQLQAAIKNYLWSWVVGLVYWWKTS